MKKILLIIPYFGKFNNYFLLWLKSAEWNNTIDFLIITDNFVSKANSNIKVINMELSDMVKHIQSCFDFNISFESPYEMYKFKPAYGYIFSEYIKGYDFWGYCDLNLVFGDIREFLTEEILLSYDKILTHSQFMLFRNCEKMNRLFMTEFQGCWSYKDIFKSEFYEDNLDKYFDEFSKIAEINNVKAYDKNFFADLDDLGKKTNNVLECENKFTFDKYTGQILKWSEGKLYKVAFYGDKEKATELAYVHFKDMKVECNNVDFSENRFIIT